MTANRLSRPPASRLAATLIALAALFGPGHAQAPDRSSPETKAGTGRLTSRPRPEAPSMMMAVKSHQEFFVAARTDHAAGLVPSPGCVPALLPSILFPPPPSPHPRLGEGGGKRMLLDFAPGRLRPCGASPSAFGRLASASVRAPGPNDRLSVWDPPRPQAPGTVYASSVRHASSKSPPIERTVPSQVHPAAQRRLSPTSLGPPAAAAALLTPPPPSALPSTRLRRLTAPPPPRPWRAAAPSN